MSALFICHKLHDTHSALLSPVSFPSAYFFILVCNLVYFSWGGGGSELTLGKYVPVTV